MKTTIKLLTFILVFLGILNTHTLSIQASSVRILAIVNGEAITSYDVEERAKLSTELLKTTKVKLSQDEIKRNVLSEMIDDLIKVSEAKKFGIKISQDELQDATKRMEKYLNLPPGGYESIAQKIGINKDVINKQIEADVLWMKFVYSVLRGAVIVSPSEINIAIDNMQSEKHTQYDIVSFIPKDDYMDKLQLVSNCEDFINFAKQNGESGSGVKLSLTDSQMDKKLLYMMKVAQINTALPPIKINDKDNIFFLCNISDYKPEITDEMRREIEYTLLQGKLEAYANKYFEKIKSMSVIDIKKNQ